MPITRLELAADGATTEMIRRRVRADITQVELAEELGISRRALQMYEAGQTLMPRARTRDDYLEAIEAIKARRATQSQKAS